jgi:hypothetical protein
MIWLAKAYSSESFTGCNDPLESVLFSAMIEMGVDSLIQRRILSWDKFR